MKAELFSCCFVLFLFYSQWKGEVDVGLPGKITSCIQYYMHGSIYIIETINHSALNVLFCFFVIKTNVYYFNFSLIAKLCIKTVYYFNFENLYCK